MGFDLNVGSTTLTNIDNANGMSLINRRGQTVVVGGEFNYPQADELQRNVSIARVTDHAKHLMIDAYDGLINSTQALTIKATRLQEALNPILGVEIVGATVTPTSASAGTENYTLRLSVIHPTERIVVHIIVAEVPIAI